MNIVIGVLLAILIAFLALYVTWLFVSRLRAKESMPKSFLRWLRDLFDLAAGLG
jgi:hypothetical protein